MAIGAIVALVVGTAASISENRKAAKADKEARDIGSAQNQVDAIRAKRTEARKARVRRAQIEQSAENSGVVGSSGEAGSLSSVASRLGAFSGNIEGRQLTATAISSANQNAAEHRFKSAVHQQLGNLGSSLASAG